jgi:hypothetical protein
VRKYGVALVMLILSDGPVVSILMDSDRETEEITYFWRATENLFL